MINHDAITRRDTLLGATTLVALGLTSIVRSAPARAQAPTVGVGIAPSASALPNMPKRNPWLADSVYPQSHFNPGATDSVLHAGPARGRPLTVADVKTVPLVFVSNPTVKKVGNETIIIAATDTEIKKINATGTSLQLVSSIPVPGLEAVAAKGTPEAIAAVLAEADAAARAKDESKIVALAKTMAGLGFSYETIPYGVYNLIDRDGFNYAAYDLKIVKTTDDNDPKAPLRVAKVKDFTADIPAELKQSITSFTALNMTYDGYIAAAARGGMLLVDRDLNTKAIIPFAGEAVENGICVDETGVYVVTSRRMLKIVWTGAKLSYDEADGGWQSEYNTMTHEEAVAAGALTQSGGSGTTPTLMGFGDDPDKLVIIADGDRDGTHVVAFWRDKIPDGFQQKPGTKSRRIADQIRTDISKVTIEPSPNVLGYGTMVLNCRYPQPVPGTIYENAMTAGLTRPAPMGAQKFTWNTRTKSFEKAWINREVDNSDVMVPVVSAATNMVYAATKTNGRYEYVGLDWDTGEIKARWPFPDDSRQWNAYGGITTILENGDLLIGGLFALKRVTVG
ncbi:hypothetical protein ACVIHI_001892 [Bradyrhizobium sp. USDA 4524]|uniref:hypothetical protein n=1 Tax=unclassified Bradyrhizobium TaxID=2631580 RepID=UPI00209F65AB|nr:MULTISPECIES: hypothetical protein [unclassified Bradyrhizobium]MCP1845187.1 hypothetical protein [Bradyrhizobium sp. USDA 4538]MCP1905752.1 hypothetical protein [Bradyrhizobium sp. USDA 4537]MCP1988592.1 hypothetical protein [Bradyrhizobium sp. USDA 4539]